ncbi:MAG: RNA polymerase sigma factor [Opitutaceae bacterium]|nr:RNA polymerase sigma factor [Opitutaceae bacterium]
MPLDELYRREYGRILASLIRRLRDITLAEDALQEAFAAAVRLWPEQGPPENPVAWLMVTARHKAIDQLRRRTLAENKHEEMITLATPEENAPVPQDTLRLIFTCCHPSLAREAQVALTLRTVCGLSTEEIARAFLVPVPTLAQRLVRAKTKIRLAGIPYEVPDDDELPERLEPVLATLYLVFNEGYSASFGPELVRGNLCAEAIRLGRQLVELLPEAREPRGLLALMLLNDSRRATRTDATGAIVLLEDQDRSRWDRERIAEGAALVESALRGGPPGLYAVQAAIAALHAQAPTWSETDWPQIVQLYGILLRLHPSPVVALNRAAAVAMAEGCERGLALMAGIDLPGYHLLPAARADLLRRLGRRPEAAAAYREALALVNNDAERRYLEGRLREVEAGKP